MATQGGTSRLTQMQMRFQQRQQQEKEQRKLEITGTKNHLESGDRKTVNATFSTGKVRQMFDERRQRSTGIDKSYPLKPIAPRTNQATTTVTKTSVTSSLQKQRVKQINGTTTVNENIETTMNRTLQHGDEVLQNKLNGNITHDNNFNDYDVLDNEEFPEASDNEILTTISTKLPNVGKLASPGVEGKQAVNGDNNNIRNKSSGSYNHNNNNIKLKPLPSRRVSPVETNVRTVRKSGDSINRLTTVQSPMPTETSKTTPTRFERKTNSGGHVQNSSPTKKVQSPARMATPTKVVPPAIQTAPPEGSVACKICGRYFNKDRIEKHEIICQRTATKKRKIFDATKHRVKGTEAEKYVKKSLKSNNSRTTVSTQKPSQESGAKKSDWRRKHEEFIQAIRAAKEVQAHLARGGKLSDLPPPPPSENPDYVQCPHCSRRFNEAAATRHIPKCASMLHNKPKPGAAPKKKR